MLTVSGATSIESHRLNGKFPLVEPFEMVFAVPASVKEIAIVEAGAFFNVKAQPLVFAGLLRFRSGK